MKFKNIQALQLAMVFFLSLAFSACQKMDHPALGDYPKDTNPPGGPLKFYAALNGTDVDSIRANFGTDENVTWVTGVNQQGYKGSTSSYIKYPSPNDFGKSTSFTVSFWMKKDGPPAAGTGTQWVFGIPTTDDIWHKHMMFLEFEDANNPSSSDLAAAKFLVQDQWFEFTGAKRIPNLLNNQWHHVAFVYDETTSKLTTYVDAVPQFPNDASVTDVKNNGNPRGALSMTGVAGLVIGGPGHWALNQTPDGWMGNFDGQLDQFRLYSKALTAAEITNLYTNKL